MKTTFMLADSAQAVDGKLYLLGGGWSDIMMGPDGHVPPHAIVVLIHVPWDQANRQHHLVLELRNADGNPVEPVPGQPIRIESQFETGRPPGTHPGCDLSVPVAINLGPLPLNVGRYVWTLDIDAEPAWSTTVGFTVRLPGAPMRLAG